MCRPPSRRGVGADWARGAGHGAGPHRVRTHAGSGVQGGRRDGCAVVARRTRWALFGTGDVHTEVIYWGRYWRTHWACLGTGDVQTLSSYWERLSRSSGVSVRVAAWLGLACEPGVLWRAAVCMLGTLVCSRMVAHARFLAPIPSCPAVRDVRVTRQGDPRGELGFVLVASASQAAALVERLQGAKVGSGPARSCPPSAWLALPASARRQRWQCACRA